MSLPPERISIKRRRQDDPVETLILEQAAAQNKRRRFADYYFQRLPNVKPSEPGPKAKESTAHVPNHTTRDYQSFGIPIIKPTAPGDEIRDFARYKADQQNTVVEVATSGQTEVDKSSSLSRKESATSNKQLPVSARRFHLTRDLFSSIKVSPSTNSGRLKSSLRPPLATFIERRDLSQSQSIYGKPPVDKLVELKDKQQASDGDKPLDLDLIDKRTSINTFQKPPLATSRRGKSIRDDPSTWDQDSDELANELAALAFDIDPADADEPPMVLPISRRDTTSAQVAGKVLDDPMIVDSDGDFVIETYVRVKHSQDEDIIAAHHSDNIGVLVIDDENEDLWQKYINSDDDDDEWDDEDEDSNAEDNPRNEYPDDEVSSDDEFGRNVYKHRRNASDDEEYDQEADW